MLPAPMLLPTCDEVAARLSEFLDGELGPIATARGVLHLRVCPMCARFASELAATVAALHRLPHGAGAPYPRALH